MRTTGPHIIVPPAAIEGATATITGEEAHHLVTVLQKAPGDPVSVADGAGRLFQGRIVELGRDVPVALLDSVEIPRAAPLVRVVHALPKSGGFDDVVGQLTELGVEEIAPVTTERTELDPEDESAERALARWRIVAHAAAKRSRQAWLPEVLPVTSWAEGFPHSGPGVVCWEGATSSLRDVLGDPAAAERITIGVGPEEGLTTDELAEPGLPTAALGVAVLRTETAGLVAASALLTLAGRLG